MIAIIGGGYAGMAAAVELAHSGIPVTVFEAGCTLGGRARRVELHGLPLDNGQHLLLGAYRETLRLMALAGVAPHGLIRQPLALHVPGEFSFRPPALPAPLHLLAGMLSTQGLSLAERMSALHFSLGARLCNFRLKADSSVAKLLAQYKQSERLVRLLWEPLCLSALNTPLAQASAQVFLNVLRDSFSHARCDSDMLFPAADLSNLFPEAAASVVQAHGGNVRLGERIQHIRPTAQGFELVSASRQESFSRIICATAPQHVRKLIAGLPDLALEQAQLAALQYQPIATVYLQYPPEVTLPEPMLGLQGGIGQWVFDRGRTHGQRGLLAVVISAEGGWVALPPEVLCGRVEKELSAVFDLPPPQWHQAIVEKRATFACTPGMARPDQQTALPGFFLAGDYTAGDYPATLEGAVRSGVRCARLILRA